MTVTISEAIRKLVDREDLTEEQAAAAMEDIMSGRATPAQIAGFLIALRMKGETVEEIAGCARTMRRLAVTIRPRRQPLIDIVGTGGDGANTFNISTAAAIVAAAAGAGVAKHGNRAVSSRCGSADVLEALGVGVDVEPAFVQRCIEEAGIGFMFAPRYHRAMKFAAEPRRELAVRTVFNVLGPLTNPAGVQSYVLGVYDPELVPKLAYVLHELGVERAYVVHGAPGMDEFSICGETLVASVEPAGVRQFAMTPEDVGLRRAALASIMGGSVEDNAERIITVLTGAETGPPRDAVALNAGAGLVVAGLAKDLRDGVAMAVDAIASGRAYDTLETLRRLSGGRAA